MQGDQHPIDCVQQPNLIEVPQVDNEQQAEELLVPIECFAEQDDQRQDNERTAPLEQTDEQADELFENLHENQANQVCELSV